MDGRALAADRLIDAVAQQVRRAGGQCVRWNIPPREPEYGTLSPPLSPPLEHALAAQGIRSLYRHQVEGISAVRAGEHLLVATATASGKSLVYHLPVLERLWKEPDSRALYLFPIKALEQDQLKSLERLIPPGTGFRAAILDGDTPASRRSKLRQDPPHILISNPDLLHLSLLPYHESWQSFFRTLRFVVLDELHTYRGIFGSHIAHVLRRLRRVAAHCGAFPQFITCSATVRNPNELARTLTGLPFRVITDDTSPERGKHFVLINPTRSPYAEATDLLRRAIRAGYKAIAFTKARKITELITMWIREADPALAERIRAYRAGYTPEERRDIEAALFADRLAGVVSTSALELGIDVGGLDVCILVGYPGSVVSTWQRGGRVGRGDREALIFLVALPDALDQYLIRHPSVLFGREFEPVFLDPDNPEIRADHLTAAAAELPLTVTDTDLYGHHFMPTVTALTRQGRLVQSAAGDAYYSRVRLPQRQISIRSTGEAFPILRGGQTLGSIGGHRALHECHPGAIYLHQGRQYEVTELDLAGRRVRVREVDVDYYTQPTTAKETEILEVLAVQALPGGRATLGRLRVTERVLGYEKRRVIGQDRLGSYPLDLPPRTFETVGLWLAIPAALTTALREQSYQVMGSLHAAEHTMIALLPLLALCDRQDIGGISMPLHPQVEGPAIFIYDGYPGGIGLTKRGHHAVSVWLQRTRDLLAECPCEGGCPACVHSPKCGSGNKPLDKAGALYLLDGLLGHAGLPERAAEPLRTIRTPSTPPPIQRAPRGATLVFDLETQRSAEEVGGWEHRDRMGLAVAVTADLDTGEVQVYTEANVGALLDALSHAALIIGFNVKRFDYGVLSAYTRDDLQALPTLDLLQEVTRVLGFRLSLDHLVRETLGTSKTADGLQSLRWFKAGAIDKVIEYCKADVALTAELYRLGREHGYLLYRDYQERLARVPVDFSRKPFASGQGLGTMPP
ncbi:MAG: DEAD/DEAH box helicase [Candidatus Methylomirabilales bacterium]